ncbi:MAG: SDR family oxidoreductase, partial [Planctomycetota bacterium]|nr:SDR family oxidoreductase [Planctomycetota bacterium]
MEKLLAGKTGVIFGVANKRSLAWACARSLADAGMRLCFTYVGERLEQNVRALAAEVEGSIVVPCDVTKPEDVDAAFKVIA